MKRSQINMTGLVIVWTLLIGSTSACLLPDYDFCRIRPRLCPVEQIESEILQLELHGRDLQQVSEVLAQRGFQNGGRRDDELLYKKDAVSESVDLGRQNYVVFRKEESDGFLMSRVVCITCILGENDRVKDLIFSTFDIGP